MDPAPGLPYDAEAERVVVGALLTWPTLLPEAAKLLDPPMLWETSYRAIYAALLELEAAPETPLVDGDPLLNRELVAAALRDTGQPEPPALWEGLAEAGVGSGAGGAHLAWFAHRVVDAWRRRELMQRLSQAVAQAHAEGADTALATAERLFADLEVLERRLQGGRVGSWLDGMEAARAAAAARLRERPDAVLGVSTGLPWLDQRTDGFVPGRVWVVGGYTGAGKSWFAAWATLRLLEAAQAVVHFSLEMSAADTLYKLLACKAGVPAAKAMGGTMRPDERQRWAAAEAWLRGEDAAGRYRLYTDQYRLAGMIRLVRAERPAAVVVDYVQNLAGAPGEREYDLLTGATKAFRALATAQGRESFVLLVSQLSNEGYRYGRDQDANYLAFKGSGQLGQDASVALELVRDKHQTPRTDEHNCQWVTMGLQLKKNRWGAEGTREVEFAPALGHFVEGGA